MIEDKKSELYRTIVQQISEGKLRERDRLPSERQLATEYGITVRGVKTALDKLLKEGIISREQGRGTFVRNVPESMTKKRIGLIHLTDLWAHQNILFAELYRASVGALRRKNYDIVHYPILKDDAHSIQDIRKGDLDGLILVSIPDSDLIEEIRSVGYEPICLYYFPNMDPLTFDGYGVYVEHFNAMIYAIKMLKELGHKRISYLGSWSSFPTMNLQMNRFTSTYSFNSAIEANGLTGYARTMGLDVEDRAQALRDLLAGEQRPSAILTDGPDYLPLFLDAVTDLGLRIPDDVSVLTLGWPQDELSSLYSRSSEMVDAAMYLLDCQLRRVEPFSRLISLPERLNHSRTISRISPALAPGKLE